MALVFTISDNESGTSVDVGDADQSQAAQRNRPVDTLTIPDTIHSGETLGRLRQHSDSASQGEGGEFPDGPAPEEGDEAPFRGRSVSAPSELWAAMRYGRQLRRMSDEFDTLLDKGEMKRVCSAGAARQMQPSASWFTFLSSHKETESEINSSFSGVDSRNAK